MICRTSMKQSAPYSATCAITGSGRAGATVGKATMQSTWTGDHATGSIHFVGTVPRPAEWTSNSTSVFKSADCGSDERRYDADG
jgi:hypothetical protein